MTTTISLRQFIAAGLLLNDRGEPIQETPMVQALLEGWEAGAKTIVLCSPRRQGKSTVAALAAAHLLVAQPMSFTIWLSASGDQGSDILTQKLGLPLRRRKDLLERSDLDLSLARNRATNLTTGSVVEVTYPLGCGN